MGCVRLDSFSESVCDRAMRAARTNAPLLICGETGAGKTVLAKFIHQASARAHRPFLRADCGSIPESLFEREMFGHTRGAFTDAKDSQPGLLEAANGGTLFLDEIGELPLTVQPKLLSVFDDGLVRRIGSTQSISVDVRLIAATNRDLTGMVDARLFRSDLYYRLAFLKIHVPPLRERRESIPQLAVDILQNIGEGLGLRDKAFEFEPGALDCICRYEWPGNIRELEHALTFAVTYFGVSKIGEQHLPAEITGRVALSQAYESRPASRYTAPSDLSTERHSIEEALRKYHGNRTRTAKALGMSRATLWIKLRQLGIATPTYGALVDRLPVTTLPTSGVVSRAD